MGILRRMSRFHVATRLAHPGLHVWRAGTQTRLYLRPVRRDESSNWVTFEYDFEPGIVHELHFSLFEFDAEGRPANFELTSHAQIENDLETAHATLKSRRDLAVRAQQLEASIHLRHRADRDETFAGALGQALGKSATLLAFTWLAQGFTR